MGILSKVPGIGKVSEYKDKLKLTASVQGMNVIKPQYKKALNNYLVLAMGLESGVPIPKVVKNCKRFYKDNRKDWVNYLSKEPIEFRILEDLFNRIGAGNYSKEDAVWVRETWIPLFKRLSRDAELHWTKKTL